MAKFSTGKITTSAIFYYSGIPSSFLRYGTFTTPNYGMLRNIARHNIQNKRPIYSFLL